jgi:hypothetical protein
VRHSYDAVLQIRPSSNLLFTFEGLIAKTTPRDIEHAVGINDQNGGFSLDPSFKFNGPGHTLSSGTLTNAQLLFDTRSGQEDKVTREFSGSMMWKPADHWTVNVDIDHVSSHASVYSMTAYDSFGATGRASHGVLQPGRQHAQPDHHPERAPQRSVAISGPRRWIISRTITLHPGPNGPISAMRWTKAASCRRSSSVCATPARIC